MKLRTVFTIASFIFLTIFVNQSESSVFRHKVRPIRVVRESAPVRTQLADGTKFEKYVEKGEVLPPLPIGEEEADSLNDPRIGHLDKDGGIAVPVDENGKVLPGFEYLLKPITLTIDLDETDENGLPKYKIADGYQLGDNKDGSKTYEAYPSQGKNQQEEQSNPVQPKTELLPQQEEEGSEYEDVPAEPKEPLPNVPELPKPDYTDSGESDEDVVKGGDVDEENEEDEEMKKVGGEDVQGVNAQDVIIPSTLIKLPIEYEKVTEKEGEDVEIPKNNELSGGEKKTEGEEDKTDETEENEAEVNAEIAEKVAERIAEKIVEEEESLGLSDEELESLAKDLGKSVYENVMSKANDFTDFDSNDSNEKEDSEFSPVGIPDQPKLPNLPIINSEDLDGVVLPEQSLSDEELLKIEEESDKKEEKPVSPDVPSVRGARIGGGVQPDSSSQNSVIIQFLIVSLVLLFV